MSGLRIVCDENIAAVRELLGACGEVVPLSGRAIDRASLAGADALLVRSITRVDQALLDSTPVRFVGSATSGFDHVDRAYLAAAGIAFAHAPGSNANSVVEYVLAAIAAVDDFWERLEQGARVGIVGYGHVGRCLAGRLQALGFACRVSDPWLQPGEAPQTASLEEVLACDVISLHCSLTRKQPWPSYHLLDEASLSALGAGQLLINASRGAVIEQPALQRRLAAGRGPVTVLDVWENEPLVDPQLLQQVRIGTAHIAGYSMDGKLDGTRRLRQALVAEFGLDQSVLQDPGGTGLPPVELSTPLTGASLARELIASRYAIAHDDRLLREVINEPAARRGAAFDDLRRDYRARRELAGSVVRMAGATGAQKQLIAALGCSLEDASGS